MRQQAQREKERVEEGLKLSRERAAEKARVEKAALEKANREKKELEDKKEVSCTILFFAQNIRTPPPEASFVLLPFLWDAERIEQQEGRV